MTSVVYGFELDCAVISVEMLREASVQFIEYGIVSVPIQDFLVYDNVS